MYGCVEKVNNTKMILDGRFELVECVPSVSDYQKLRKAVGWGDKSPSSIEKGLNNSLYAVCIFDKENEDNIIASGRLIGDGIYHYIQDVIVLPEYQGIGLGSVIVEHILDHLKTEIGSDPDGSNFVGLMAAKDMADFYKKYGFKERNSDSPGMFMMI